MEDGKLLEIARFMPEMRERERDAAIAALMNPKPEPPVILHECDANTGSNSSEFDMPPKRYDPWSHAVVWDAAAAHWYLDVGHEYAIWITHCPFCGLKLEAP